MRTLFYEFSKSIQPRHLTTKTAPKTAKGMSAFEVTIWFTVSMRNDKELVEV